MKIKNCLLLSLGLLSIGLVSCGPKESDNPVKETNKWSVSSPDNKVNIEVSLNNDGEIHYSVKKNNTAIVEDSKLGIDSDVANLHSGLTFVEKKECTLNFDYEAISGKESLVKSSSNELRLTFREYYYYIDVVFRAYSDGYAFRYEIYKNDDSNEEIIILDELTEFNLPDKSATYAMPYVSSTSNGDTFSYEDYYNYRRSDRLQDLKISMPFLYEAGNDMYSLITESELIGSNYIGSFLESDENGTLKTIPAPAGGSDTTYNVPLPFKSPWRIGISGSLKEIVESNLVEEVYGDVEYWKPDNYDELTKEEQEIYNYDWVTPGVSAWNWLVYNGVREQNDWDLQYEYVDLASEMGWKRTILDGGWDTALNPSTLTEFVNYANSKGVKVMVWCHALNKFDTYEKRVSQLDQYARFGIEGIKVDFFDGQEKTTNATFQMEDQETLELYESLYQLCAERKMVVNCHGSNKPTGERRIYPNVINREAIRGNEFKTINTSQTTLLPFIRGVVGPSDFTPVSKPLRSGITMGQQMALCILLESGSPSMADYSENYLNQPTTEFYKNLPASWDETLFIDGDLESHCVIARRKGNEWWMGGNTIYEMDININFDFLGEGKFKTYIYEDGEDASSVNVKETEITKESNIDIKMKENGGFAIRIVRE